MDDNSTPEVVTEDEAIDKVKTWIKEMDWEKAIEGCKEILEVDPNNEEAKTLLEKAEKGLTDRPTEAVGPSEVVNKVATEAAQPAENIAEKPQAQAVAPVPPAPQQPIQPSAPTATPVPKQQAPAAQPAPVPQRKNKSSVIIAGIIGFLILVLLIVALVFGWLNPVFDWIFGLIG